jgi:hypothetical protein
METADYLVLAEPATDRFPAPHSPEPFMRDSLNISLPLVPKKKIPTRIFPSGLLTKALQAILSHACHKGSPSHTSLPTEYLATVQMMKLLTT